jgi:hypothetical protein
MLGRKLSTVHGLPVEILSPGIHNRDAGPDFLGAHLRIGPQEWFGNVEIHVKASDWTRHGHDSNPAYENVILHVVAVDDARIHRSDGSEYEQTVVTFPESFFTMYARLADKVASIPCTESLSSLPPLVISDWIESLSVERMQMKAERVLTVNGQLNGDWEQTAFAMLARSLGFGLNSDPFEMLARSIPLKTLWHHADNSMQVEALLFGQAGMLDMSLNIFNEYYQTLCREYYFLSRKYSLRPLSGSIWKYARTRPNNFPHRRIAMLATHCCSQKRLMAELLDNSRDPEAIEQLFTWQLSHYWDEHNDFTTDASRIPSGLSRGSINLLMINFVAPMLYAYGAATDNPDLAARGLDIWESLPAENNTFIRQWSAAGIPSNTAAHSQALLQLRRQYCDANRCLDCRFGHALLRSQIKPLLHQFN